MIHKLPTTVFTIKMQENCRACNIIVLSKPLLVPCALLPREKTDQDGSPVADIQTTALLVALQTPPETSNQLFFLKSGLI